MTKKSRNLKLLLTLVASISLLTCITGCAVPEGSQVGDNAPDFTLSTLDGGQVMLSEFRGKPVMLVFWTTGCSACIYQMPFLQAVASNDAANDTEFINVDIMENSYTVKSLTDYYGFDLTVALDSDGAVSEDYNVIYTPTNIIIDNEGVIRYIRKGAFLNANEILATLSDLK